MVNREANLIMFPIAMILLLFSYSDLKKCAAPLYAWVVGWWVLVFVCFFMMVLDRLRAKLGYILGIGLLVLFYCWNFAGGIIYLISAISTPECIPEDYGHFVGFFLVIIIILLIAGLWHLCKDGYAVFKRSFFSEYVNKEVIDQIKACSLNVEEHLKENSDVDDYTLFDSERQVLKSECVIHMVPEGRAAPLMPKNNQQPNSYQSLISGNTCSICSEDFVSKSGRSVLEFPHCKHLYHETCIMKHLETKTRCPLCNQGVRSGLYRDMDAKRSRRL